MKKKSAILTALMLALCVNAQTFHFDVDGNGSVEITDALWVIDYILGRYTPVDDNPPQSYLTCPDDHHPHLIDLGLPSGTKWACCNVDTDHPENQSPGNYGGYYAWGETNTKPDYVWSTYIHCDGEYNNCHDIGSDISGTRYDVAHVAWGGSWEMPSLEQAMELITECSSEKVMLNGLDCRRFTGKNGGVIFLPASGYREGNDIYHNGYSGFYWTSTKGTQQDFAYYFFFVYDAFSGTEKVDWAEFSDRYFGHCVRPVSR